MFERPKEVKFSFPYRNMDNWNGLIYDSDESGSVHKMKEKPDKYGLGDD